MKIRIKICGLTNPEDIQSCYRAGADAIGINMIPSSPRYVPVQKIPQLCQDCPPFLSLVGLWPQQHFRQVTAQAYQLGISEIQWYGNWEEAVLSYPFRILFVLRLREEINSKVGSTIGKMGLTLASVLLEWLSIRIPLGS